MNDKKLHDKNELLDEIRGLREEIRELKENIKVDKRDADIKKNKWYFGKHGYERWIVETQLHKKWKRTPSEAYHYLNMLSDKEKKELKEKWNKEMKEHIKKLKQKGEI